MADDQLNRNKFFLINERKPTWKLSVRVAVIYLVFGILWVFLSDSIVSFFVHDPELITRISIVKGFAYVLLSALIIFFTVNPALKKLSDSEQVILENRNELKTMLYYDHLTGLSNRRKLIERLPDFLEDATSKGKALLFIDIDNIKLINDTMGHTFGDSLIAETSKRLASVLIPPDEVYRLGGDEFIILTKFSQITALREKADTIQKLFTTPFMIDKSLIHCTISIGISLYPMHSKDPGELMKCADIAMYQAKNGGKNTTALYNNNMMSAINDRMSIGEYLHEALEHDELEVYYQPQINTETRRITGYEALLRWNNRVLGKVTPDRFICVAEETHLIIPIGEWILRKACEFLKKMHNKGYSNLSISINVSIIQLLQDDFAKKTATIIEECEVDPARVELEITESVLMESHSVIREHLDDLRQRGIGIALDDFGKGYSSLSYLEQLPITTLKVDKSFIDRITDAANDTSVTGNIVRIGKKLGLSVVAEGVETEMQLAYLTYQQCDRIQGWIFSKALTEADAEDFTEKNMENVAN